MRNAARRPRQDNARIIHPRDSAGWVSGEITRLRNYADGAGPNTPMQQLLRLRAAIMEDPTEAAVSALRRLCADNPQMFASNPSFSHQALLSFLWAMEIEDIEEWARTQRFGGGKLSLRLVEQGVGDTLAMSAEFTDQRGALFDIPRELCRHRNLDGAFRRLMTLLPMFRHYLDSAHYRPGRIAFNWGDRPSVAGLALCGNQPDHFLIPDNLFLGSDAYQDIKALYAQDQIAWADRQPVAFWRGASTGKRTDASWRTLPRAQLAVIANSPEAAGLFDVGISKLGQVSQEEAEEMQRAGVLRDYVPATNSNRYRYNIDIDGNTNAWSGFFHKLCAGSPVLKVASNRGWRQWYYDRLMPWMHFVPIETDMSDLIEKVRWLNAHPDIAAAIGLRGQQFAAAMTLDGEIERAAVTIAQAIGRLTEGVDVDLSFGLAGTARTMLRDCGWQHEEHRSWCGGVSSELVLPAISNLAAWQVRLEAEGYVHADKRGPRHVPSQRLMVFTNGEEVGRFELGETPTEIVCDVSQAVVRRAPDLTLTLIHPDGVPPALFESEGDTALRSIALRRLRLSRQL